MNRKIIDHIKNIPGWRTERKLIVFSVDDYGNVRVHSKEAREKLNKAGLKIVSRFDQFDSLENSLDLEYLFETLTSVKDKNGNYSIFTPFALPCNINFEEMRSNGFTEYVYEPLYETLQKINGYEGVYSLILEGIKKKIFLPQFHGREHFNLKVFNEKLIRRDKELLTALNNNSCTSISNSGYSTISFTAAYEFDNFKENNTFDSINRDGLYWFENVYGYRAVHFNAPGGSEHPIIHKTMAQNGIKYYDTAFLKNEHQGSGKYVKRFNYNGKKHQHGIYMVRNCVFEPTKNQNIDWVSYTLKQIETAFRWHKPAIISSHRVNFCGHIDPQNRATGIKALRELLRKIVERWPDVEFISADKLAELML